MVKALLGWPLWLWVIRRRAAIVLSYITLGGLSAAIYDEVLQFFVIVAALLPLTLVGLAPGRRLGPRCATRSTATPAGPSSCGPGPATALTAIANPFLSVLGIVFGLGFVLSFGYWTTNFVEVQRALATKSMSAARRTPIIGAYPKMSSRSSSSSRA